MCVSNIKNEIKKKKKLIIYIFEKNYSGLGLMPVK